MPIKKKSLSYETGQEDVNLIAMQRLQQVKTEWESTIDSVPQLICVLREDGVVLRVNRTIEHWRLGEVNKVNGKNIHDLIHPHCKAKKCPLKKFFGMSSQLLSSGDGLEYHGFDTELNRNLLVQLIPVGLGGDLESGQLVVIFREINQKSLAYLHKGDPSDWVMEQLSKHAHNPSNSNLKATLSKSTVPASALPSFKFIENVKREWESAVDSLPQIICLLEQDGAIVRANRAIEHWKLGSVITVKGRNIHEMLHSGCEDKDCYLKGLSGQIKEVLASGRPVECNKQDVILNRYLHFQINPSAPTHVATQGLVVLSVSDISNIKHAEIEVSCLNDELERRIKSKTKTLNQINHQLRHEIELRILAESKFKESRRKFSSLVETMNEGMVIQDVNLNISYINKHLLKLLGLTRSQVVGRPFTDFIDNDYLENWTEEAGKAVKTYGVFKIKNEQGHSIWVKGKPQVMLDEEKNISGSFAVITDINEQIETELALLSTKQKLRGLAKQVLVAQEVERKRIASELHDGIVQTLSAIKYYVENSLADFTDSPIVAGIHKIEQVVPKLQLAIEEVRRISMDLRPSILDDMGIIATLNWFCRECRSAYPKVQFSFMSTNLNENEIIINLKTEIFRIVQEATNNSLKYSQSKSLDIILKGEGGKIKLEIIDKGIGFNVTKVSSQQGYSESKGMGLVSMRERVTNAGGEFFMQSEINMGTTVACLWNKDEPSVADQRVQINDRRKKGRLI